MARLLWIVPAWPWPPRQGASLRVLGLAAQLTTYHDLHLLAGWQRGSAAEGEGPEDVSGLSLHRVDLRPRSRWRRLAQLAFRRLPDLALRLDTAAFADALRPLLTDGRFDLVQIEGLELGCLVNELRRLAPGCPILLDAHNAETALQQRALEVDRRQPGRWHAALYSWLQRGRLRRFERSVCERVDAVVAVSARDAGLLATLAPDCNIDVVANGVDAATWSCSPQHAAELDLCFVGKFDFRPNLDGALWFLRAIWPVIQTARPGTRMTLVGQCPPANLLREAARCGVAVTGAVPSVAPWVHGAALSLLPLRMGSGTRLKLLEAMAAGRAIVATTVAAEGVPVVHDRELRLADDAASFAREVLALLDDSEARARLGAAARELAQRFDWVRIVPAMETVYARLGVHR